MNKSRVTLTLGAVLAMTFLAGCGPVTPPTPNDITKTVTDEAPLTKDAQGSIEVKSSDEKSSDSSAKISNDEITFIAPAKIDGKKVLANYLSEMTTVVPDWVAMDGAQTPEEYLLTSLSFYDVGTIKKAPYAGQKLVVANITCDGPCFTATISRFAWDEKTGALKYLDALSNEDYMPEYLAPLTKDADENFVINVLNLPNTLMLPDQSNSAKMVYRDADFHSGLPEDTDNFVTLGKVAYNDPKWGDVYFSESAGGCLFLPAPDGSIATYNFDPGLLQTSVGRTIQWDDGSDASWVTDDYVMKAGGCGIGNGCYMVEPVTADQLELVGKTDHGMKIYMAKKTAKVTLPGTGEDPSLDIGQQDLNATYDTYLDMFEYLPEDTRPAKPVTYEEYLNSKPIVYWQDPFGRYSAIMRTEYRPPAECGKPVIYLYPEEPTLVSVKVLIDEFTKTEPAYNDGWKVLADTESNLLNLADGKTYPYLFWEGKSSKQLEMTGGFVIAKENVDSFLVDSLAKLGLNEQESADFRDFWVSRMQAVDQPYLLISFAGTSAFNQVAPLEISPAPDSLLRVFMYYQPLWQPIEVHSQTLTAPERHGFTVVEWGGTSSDGWQTR